MIDPKPKALQSWINGHFTDVDHPYPAALNQAIFVRDALASVVCRGLSYEQCRETGIVWVIGEHTSKSIVLPVYSIEPPSKGIRFILRNNWYNWKISVISDREITVDSLGLFRADPPVVPDYEGNDLLSCYFEGFPESLVFDYYDTSDKKKFSAAIGSDEALWTFMFLCMKSYERHLWEELFKADRAKTLEDGLKYRKEKATDEVARLEFQLASKRKEAGL